MNSLAFPQIVSLISTYGYFVLLLFMVVEGPIVTTAAAFAAGAGIFNIYAILLLSILGDSAADILYYTIGYWGRTALVEKYGRRFGLSPTRVERVQRLLHKNAWATIIAIKLAPGLAPPGLIAVGGSKMPLKRYLKIVSAITLPKCIFFTVLGFYAERVNDVVLKYFHLGIYGFPLAFILIVLIIFLYQKFSRKIARKFQKI